LAFSRNSESVCQIPMTNHEVVVENPGRTTFVESRIGGEGSVMSDKTSEPWPSEPEAEDLELRDRREFLVGLGKWSKVVIGGVLLGGVLAPDREAGAQGWSSQGGSGGIWYNSGGGWGGWLNGPWGGYDQPRWHNHPWYNRPWHNRPWYNQPWHNRSWHNRRDWYNRPRRDGWHNHPRRDGWYNRRR
jgi:hypothetical protein